MNWFAVKGPDGEWYHGEGIAFETPDAAWSSVANGNPMLLRVMDAEGYRCVEVRLVEVTDASPVECAFVQGAAWWEWHKEGATMWQSDRALALEEAERRTLNGTLGRITDAPAADGAGEGENSGKD